MGAGIGAIRSDIWRHRFALRDVGLGALVIATGLLVATVLTNGPDGSATLVASDSSESSPTPPADASTSPVEPIGPSSSADTTAVPEPSPSATEPPAEAPEIRSLRPSPTPSPTAAAGYPAKGLRLDVVAKGDGALAGRTTVRVRDNDGSWNGGYISFGDGRRQDFRRTEPSCEKRSAPGESKPTDVTRTFWHAYDDAGRYDVVVVVRTERSCSGAPVEETSRAVRVTIAGSSASAPSPDPSPDPSSDPTPPGEPTPDPTSEPTFGPHPR